MMCNVNGLHLPLELGSRSDADLVQVTLTTSYLHGPEPYEQKPYAPEFPYENNGHKSPALTSGAFGTMIWVMHFAQCSILGKCCLLILYHETHYLVPQYGAFLNSHFMHISLRIQPSEGRLDYFGCSHLFS